MSHLGRTSFVRVALVCVLMIAQSLVPFSTYAYATMRCAAPATPSLCATQVLDAPAVSNQASTMAVTPDCCKHMKLDCPMRRAQLPATAMHPRSDVPNSAATTQSPRQTCLLTVSTAGSDRSIAAAAPVGSFDAPVSTQPASSAAPQRPTLDATSGRYFSRPPPVRQSQIALGSLLLHAPPTA